MKIGAVSLGLACAMALVPVYASSPDVVAAAAADRAGYIQLADNQDRRQERRQGDRQDDRDIGDRDIGDDHRDCDGRRDCEEQRDDTRDRRDERRD